MIMKQILCTLLVAFFALIAQAQVTVNDEGDCYVGDGTCFFGFEGSESSQWSSVNPERLNIEGGVSIAFYKSDFIIGDYSMIPFSIAPSIRRPQTMASPIFYVTESGSVYSRDALVQLSDSTMKTNISPLTSTLSKIQMLNGVSYNYKNGTNTSQQNTSSARSGIQNDAPKRIGLLAQEVEKVYPEVIRTFSDGAKGIMYTDLVAVLVEGMKEMNDSLTAVNMRYDNLQNQVDSLKMQLEALVQSLSPQSRSPKSDSENNQNSPVQEAALYQNVPNPFNHMTEIAYRLTPNAHTASINVYDLNGKLLKNYPLQSNGVTGKIEISASDLEPGMYIYALVIDGRMIDSKRMILNH